MTPRSLSVPMRASPDVRLAQAVLALFAVAFLVWGLVLPALASGSVQDPFAVRVAFAGLATVALGLTLASDRLAAYALTSVTTVAVCAAVVATWLAWANPSETVYVWQLVAVLGAAALALRDSLSFRVFWFALAAAMLVLVIAQRRAPDDVAFLLATAIPLFILHGVVVTREYLLQDQIAERTTLLREVFENATDALFVVAPEDGRILLANHRSAEMFGAPDVDLLLDREVLELPAGTMDETFVEQIWAVAEGGEEVRMELPFRRFHGHPFWGDAAWRGIELGDRRYTLLRITRIDDRIHAQHALESARDAAEAATVAKSNFLASISHEIRTPLNGVLGLASLLEQTSLGEEQKAYVGTLITSGRSLMSLIDELLDFSRVEAGELVIVDESFDLATCVDDLRLLFRAQAEAKDLAFDIQVDDDVPSRIQTDGKRVRQVLVNLLGNALKFTESGDVRLAITRETTAEGKDRVRFRVTDTGIGIAEDDLPRLFEPFSQGDPGIARRYGGTGLGLAISKTLADRLGGRLDARSEVGVGSTFTFEIPLRAVSASAARPGPRPGSVDVPVDRKRPVLLAEDNEVNRMVVVAMLTRLGCDVDTAEDGAQAVERAGQRTYDVVFMDVMMPGMDGLEATRRIRTLDLPRRPYVVALTAGVMPGDRDRCTSAGMDDFVAKPVQFDDLRHALARADAAATPSG